MKFEIKNIETLIVFFNKHFDKISNKEYQYIIYETLQVFSDDKPKTKELAIAKVKEIWSWIETHPKDWERPLFFLDEEQSL